MLGNEIVNRILNFLTAIYVFMWKKGLDEIPYAKWNINK